MKSNTNYSLIIQPHTKYFKEIIGVFLIIGEPNLQMNTILTEPWENNFIFQLVKHTSKMANKNEPSLDYVVLRFL